MIVYDWWLLLPENLRVVISNFAMSSKHLLVGLLCVLVILLRIESLDPELLI